MSTALAWSGACTAAWAKYNMNGLAGLDALLSRIIEMARSQKSSVTKYPSGYWSVRTAWLSSMRRCGWWKFVKASRNP